MAEAAQLLSDGWFRNTRSLRRRATTQAPPAFNIRVNALVERPGLATVRLKVRVTRGCLRWRRGRFLLPDAEVRMDEVVFEAVWRARSFEPAAIAALSPGRGVAFVGKQDELRRLATLPFPTDVDDVLTALDQLTVTDVA